MKNRCRNHLDLVPLCVYYRGLKISFSDAKLRSSMWFTKPWCMLEPSNPPKMPRHLSYFWDYSGNLWVSFCVLHHYWGDKKKCSFNPLHSTRGQLSLPLIRGTYCYPKGQNQKTLGHLFLSNIIFVVFHSRCGALVCHFDLGCTYFGLKISKFGGWGYLFRGPGAFILITRYCHS